MPDRGTESFFPAQVSAEHPVREPASGRSPESDLTTRPLGVHGAKTSSPTAGRHSNRAYDVGPGAFWLASGFVLAGIGTVMLGPLLPWLSGAWHLSDAQGGVLLAAKFIGSFIGGFSVPRRLRVGVLLGAILCSTGFGLFALSTGLLTGSICLFLAGLGLGQVIASTNILVSRRYPDRPGAALSLVNLFWSLGAVLTGVLAAALIPRFGLRGPLLSYAASFLVIGLAGTFGSRSAVQQASTADSGEMVPLPRKLLLHFACLLFFYGGLETSLSAWLTTYSLRFSEAPWMGGQAAVVVMWTALTAGRFITSLLMRRWSELTIRNVGLAVALGAVCGLLATSERNTQLIFCAALGLSLAPFFPATFAQLMRHRPAPRVAGFVLAVSGLGAALFPWLVGVLSARTGSLRAALAVPFLLTGTLLFYGMAGSGARALQRQSGSADAFSTSE